MNSSIIFGKYLVAKIHGKYSAEVLLDSAIYQKDGMVIEIGNKDEIFRKYPNTPRIGSSNSLVMPGLINAHDHLGMSGIQMGIPYLPLELNGLARFGSRMLDPYLEHSFAACLMLESGTTAIQMMYTPGRGETPIDEISTEKVIRAYMDAGMRISYAPNLQDQNSLVAGPRGGEIEFSNSLPETLKTQFSLFMNKGYWPLNELLGASEDLFKKYHRNHNGRLTINTAPTNVHRCTDELIMGLKGLSNKYGSSCHIHVLETIYQKYFALNKYGCSAVKHLSDLGFLQPEIVCGHSVWVTEDDIGLLSESDSMVCHNASSNLRVFSGIAPIPDMLQAGIKIAIGTDNMTINDDKDMFQEMRLVLKLHRIPGVEFDPITPYQIFAMGTQNGARALGIDDEVGSIEVGKLADIAIVKINRLETPFLHENASIVDVLVHRVKEQDVQTVMVNGDLVVKDGETCKIDKTELFKEIKNALSLPLTSTQLEHQALAKSVMPFLKNFYAGSYSQDFDTFSKYNAL